MAMDAAQTLTALYTHAGLDLESNTAVLREATRDGEPETPDGLRQAVTAGWPDGGEAAVAAADGVWRDGLGMASAHEVAYTWRGNGCVTAGMTFAEARRTAGELRERAVHGEPVSNVQVHPCGEDCPRWLCR
jgi:hypothetical protein